MESGNGELHCLQLNLKSRQPSMCEAQGLDRHGKKQTCLLQTVLVLIQQLQLPMPMFKLWDRCLWVSAQNSRLKKKTKNKKSVTAKSEIDQGIVGRQTLMDFNVVLLSAVGNHVHLGHMFENQMPCFSREPQKIDYVQESCQHLSFP